MYHQSMDGYDNKLYILQPVYINIYVQVHLLLRNATLKRTLYETVNKYILYKSAQSSTVRFQIIQQYM